jgi:hypothetical protein
MNTKQLLKLIEILENECGSNEKSASTNKNQFDYIGEYRLIRTYAAGVWFGKVTKREGYKIKLEDARRLYGFWCNKSISLSGVALYGVKYKDSKIVDAVPSVWIEDIEIIECTKEAIENIKNAPCVNQE